MADHILHRGRGLLAREVRGFGKEPGTCLDPQGISGSHGVPRNEDPRCSGFMQFDPNMHWLW